MRVGTITAMSTVPIAVMRMRMFTPPAATSIPTSQPMRMGTITPTGASTTMGTITPTTIIRNMGPERPPAGAGLMPLLCWLSPAFPVGAYAYSHGLEWAAEAGDVRDEATLGAWLETVLLEGAGRNDAIVLCAAHRAACAGDAAALRELNDLALALAPSAELRLETGQQGRSFLEVVLATWPAPRLAELAPSLSEVAYPVAFGLAAGSHRLPLAETVRGYLTAFAGNLVSAAIRLAPIGQTAGQRVLARLVADLARLAEAALSLDLDDVGGPTFRADLGSFRHETQYTRLFRS